MTIIDHHGTCPRAQAWDVADVPCRCPKGWPTRRRRVHVEGQPGTPSPHSPSRSETYRKEREYGNTIKE